MTNNLLNENYWTTRYLNKSTAWDTGEVTFPIKQYLDQLDNKEINILIPGAGNGYEVIYAFEKGFKIIHILDISFLPLKQFEEACPDFPKAQIHHQNFFEHIGQYDLILEQTFFCSLPPILRSDYVKKMIELLKPNGKLVGVLFGIDFQKEGPPFGGQMKEYRKLFSKEFEIVKLEPCINSIPPRMGTELFFSLRKIQ
ncbi:SAM-dependent methyltransferase [Aquiflexum sp.]|uniref:SAM-dependent methyltransferase n=1 Tax=Aquiflexum sp. TaxID=1872584 RepID=UPI00359308D2